MSKNLIRVRDACARLGIGRTTFYRLVNDKRIKLVNIGPGVVAAVEDEDKSPGSIDKLIEELLKEGHAKREMPDTSKEARARKAQRTRR
jgi:excisionase family DNA binding protein